MNRIFLVLSLLAFCLAQAPSASNSHYMTFDEFIDKFHKSYKPGSEEYESKKEIYQFNLEELAKKNCPVCGVTKFFDVAPSNFVKKILNLEEKSNPVSSKLPEHDNLKLSAPRSLDWRNYGAVTSIKDQGECGCCWSFATIAMSESSLILKGEAKKNIDLSEQYLLRCTKDSDCNGGFIENAVDQILKNGAPSEEKYPYEPYKYSSSSICLPRIFDQKISSKPRQSFYRINDEQIKDLLTSGPLAIALSATNWEYYSSGIWKCSPTDKINHAVLLVGWEDNAWIIKNQWGSDWGEDGYIRVSMDSYSNCKIGSAVHKLWEKTLSLAILFSLVLALQMFM